MIRRIFQIVFATAAFGALGCGVSAADVFEVGPTGELVPLNAAAVQIPGKLSALNNPASLISGATAAGLSADLVAAVAWCESRFRPGVVSRAGAIGEMQLMPATAKALGVNAFDTSENYAGGSRYLATLLERYGDDLTLALAAYNAGPGAVDKYGGVPPYPETQAYVAAVLGRLALIASRSSSGAPNP